MQGLVCMKYKTNILEPTWKGGELDENGKSRGLRLSTCFTDQMPNSVPPSAIDSTVMDCILSTTFSDTLFAADIEFWKAVQEGPNWLMNANIKIDHDGTAFVAYLDLIFASSNADHFCYDTTLELTRQHAPNVSAWTNPSVHGKTWLCFQQSNSATHSSV